MSITGIVLTKNSEKTLSRCLESLSWCDELLVIDDVSTDNTVNLAKKMGAKVIIHSLGNDFAKQRNFALEQAKGDWSLFVDSDEVVSKALAIEIRKAIKTNTYNGYFLLRKDTLWGKKIQYGENGNIWLVRLAKKYAGNWEGKVHERWELKGKVAKLLQPLDHYPHQMLMEFLTEINWYTTLRAEELYKAGVRVSWYDIILYPKIKFLQNYILKKGFMDGIIGFILAILMSFHSFLVRGKLWQLQK